MAMLFRTLLILTLIAASALLAPMRGQMTGASQIEICSEAGTLTLTLDARGEPVAAHQPCPDCILCASLGPLPDSSSTASPAAGLAVLAFPMPRDAGATDRRGILPAARGPPVTV